MAKQTVRQWVEKLDGALWYAGHTWAVTAIDPGVDDPDVVIVHLDRASGDGTVLELVLDQLLDDELRRCEEMYEGDDTAYTLTQYVDQLKGRKL